MNVNIVIHNNRVLDGRDSGKQKVEELPRFGIVTSTEREDDMSSVTGLTESEVLHGETSLTKDVNDLCLSSHSTLSLWMISSPSTSRTGFKSETLLRV